MPSGKGPADRFGPRAAIALPVIRRSCPNSTGALAEGTIAAQAGADSARFTFGKRIGRLFALVYSAGLGGPETRYAEVRVFPGYNVELRGLRRDTGENEVSVGQRFRFGEAETETEADTTPRLPPPMITGLSARSGRSRFSTVA